MKGKSYLGYSTDNGGLKPISEKPRRAIGSTCSPSVCLKGNTRHCERIKEDIRKTIFESFWTMSWEAKNVFVKAHVSYISSKRHTVKNSKKHNSFIYKLPHNQECLQVCQRMFLSTLSLKINMVRNWILPKDNSSSLSNNRPSVNRSTKIGCKKYLTEFFKKLPKMESHYCRKDTTKIYIDGSFKSKADVYNDYVTKCSQDNVPPLSSFTFSAVFAELNLSLIITRKDQCDICVGFKANQVTISDYNKHISKKQRAQYEKEQDKLAAQAGRCHVFTMDVQAVKLCPNIKASAIYYKQRLQTHNFTVYNLSTHQCSNYWWNETNGDLTASSFISCIIYHLKTYSLTDSLPIIIYSDGCGYQNRNHFLSNALSIFAIENNKVIEQKYLEKGHTQMECDSAHAKIEKKLKNELIYLPTDYIRVTKEARKKVKVHNNTINMPFEALYLNYDFFKNYNDASIIRFSSIRPGRMKDDPTVSHLRSLKYLPDGSVKYKTNFDEQYKDIPTRIKKYGGNSEPKSLHSEKLSISSTKFKNLQELKSVIPPEYHYFYDTLKHTK